MFQCKVLFEDALYPPLFGRYELEESIGIYLEQNYEKISVPVPHFGGSDPADIIHDFHRVRSRTCPLNRSRFIPLADPLCFPGPDCLPRHRSGQVLRHRAQHHHRDAAAKPVGASHQRQGSTPEIYNSAKLTCLQCEGGRKLSPSEEYLHF